jgi:hypothetical protein
MADRQDRKGSLLGVIAYIAVPGERRRKAGTHFRRAGLETLKGVAALARPEAGGKDGPDAVRRERIEVD